MYKIKMLSHNNKYLICEFIIGKKNKKQKQWVFYKGAWSDLGHICTIHTVCSENMQKQKHFVQIYFHHEEM